MKRIYKLFGIIAFLGVLACSLFGCTSSSLENNSSSSTSDDGRVNVINKDKEISSLISDGKSNYSIVISKDYTETEYFAASELQSFLYQVSGTKLPLTLDTTLQYSASSKIISVGGTNALKNADGDVDYSKLNGDGFIVRTCDNSLFINGANDRGTLYGVYDWLEKCIGVKFLATDATYVPKMTTIELYETNIVELPAFPIRMFLTGPLYRDSLFLARMRMGSEFVDASSQYGGKIQWNGAVHNRLSFVPTSEYFTSENKAENAHMYCLNSSGTPIDLCMTDGLTADGKIDESMEVSAFKVSLQTLKQRVMETDKECTNFFFCQEDTTICCDCENCTAAEAKYMRSGMTIQFANLLAEEINKWSREEYDGRKVNIIVFAYYYSTNAPLNAEGNILDESCIPNEYVYVRIAPIDAEVYYSFTDDGKNQTYSAQIKNWANITENIMLWTYHTYYTNFAWYYPTAHTFKDNLSMYRSIGAEYVLLQADYLNSANWQDKINLYVASKMLWNPNQDVTALQEEFVKYYYGLAADEVLEVIGRLDEKIYEISLTGNVRFQIYETKIMDPTYYPINYLEQLVAILDGAIEKVRQSDAAEKDKIIGRLKEVKITPTYMIVHNVKTYYSDSEKVYDTVKEFVKLSEETGFNRYSEWSGDPNSLRNEYGIVD